MTIPSKPMPISFVAQVLSIALAMFVLVWTIHFRGGLAWESTNKNLIFNLHPVLMLIGFIFLGGQAIMSYKALPFKKEVKKVIHLALHAVVLVIGIVGICAAFKNHNESNIANMYNFHSWVGIGVIVLYDIQWIYGFVVFLYLGGTANIRQESFPWHVVLGTFVYVTTVGNVGKGFLEKLTFLENSGLDKFGVEAYLVNFTAVATILYGAFVTVTVISQHSPPHHDDHSYSTI